MSVQFHEPSTRKRRRQQEQKPLLVRWVLKTGVVSKQRHAEYILLGIAGLSIIVASTLIFGGDEPPLETQQEYRPDTQYGGRDIPDPE